MLGIGVLLYLPTTLRANGEPLSGGYGYLIGALLTVVFVFGALNGILALTVHACAQAAAAEYFGDPTPRSLNRVSLNPFRHFDMIGWTLFGATSTGWPLVVPVYATNLRRRRLHWVLSAAAGPAANMALAAVAGFTLHFDDGLTFAEFMLHANLSLALFSLIPIPPLAGFSIVFGLLPESAQAPFRRYWDQLWHYGPIVLAVVIVLPIFVSDAPSLPHAINELSQAVAPMLGGYEAIRER